MRRRETGFQLAVIGAGGLFYLCNRLVLTPRVTGAAGLFLGWYANDIFAGAVILAIANLLLVRARLPWRLDRPCAIVPFLLLCGLAWEVLPTLYKSGAVFDWYDFLCYFIGGGLYYLAVRAWGDHAR